MYGLESVRKKEWCTFNRKGTFLLSDKLTGEKRFKYASELA